MAGLDWLDVLNAHGADALRAAQARQRAWQPTAVNQSDSAAERQGQQVKSKPGDQAASGTVNQGNREPEHQGRQRSSPPDSQDDHEQQVDRAADGHDAQDHRAADGHGVQTISPTGRHDHHDDQDDHDTQVLTREDDEKVKSELVAAARPLAKQLARSGISPGKFAFRLAKRLRAIEGADDAVGRNPQVLRPAVEAFCHILEEARTKREASRPNERPRRESDDNLDFSAQAVDEVLVDVLDAWSKVREPGDALTRAFERARLKPIELLSRAADLGAKFQRLMSAAYHLQVDRGDNPIWLPVNAVAVLLKTHPSRVSSMLGLARQLELLFPEDSSFSYAERRAKSYRFNVRSQLYVRPRGGG